MGLPAPAGLNPNAPSPAPQQWACAAHHRGAARAAVAQRLGGCRCTLP